MMDENKQDVFEIELDQFDYALAMLMSEFIGKKEPGDPVWVSFKALQTYKDESDQENTNLRHMCKLAADMLEISAPKVFVMGQGGGWKHTDAVKKMIDTLRGVWQGRS